ncbi:MAG TPA: hypothetical protein VN786_03880 [Acidimicrobiales bacterium]|nr:hypothetical protein [Acidimicrobiales bacterium]
MTRTDTRGLGSRPRGTLAAGALIAIALLAAACGGGSHPSGVASLGKTKPSSAVAGGVATTLPSGASVEEHFQKALKFSECMRSNGIANFPDPKSSGGIQIGSSSGIDPQSPQFQSAQKACRKYFPVPDLSKAQIAQSEAQALEFAKCMRANGVPNFPDPQFGPNGGELVKPVPGVDPNSPSYQAATNKCNG